jgi:hypothetical protein
MIIIPIPILNDAIEFFKDLSLSHVCLKEALQKPGFFKEFLGGQVSRAGKRITRYTCSQANLSNNKITKKDSF